MSDPFKNLLDQQRRQQEQQQKMWQEQIRKQQLYGYLSQKQKDAKVKTLFVCSVCGSTSEVKYCTMCKRPFCRIHLPVKSFGNINLPTGKTGMIGHVCILSRQRTDRAKPPTPMRPLTKKQAEEVKSDERMRTVNKWECPICEHLNPEDEDSCEECGFFNEQSSGDIVREKED